MSALGSGDVLKPILMRSSTPAPNEKVMTYLESMSREGADSSPPASIVDHEEYQSNRSGSQRPMNGIYSPHKSQSSQLRDLAASPVSYRNVGPVEDVEEDGDADSLEQQRSEGGTALPVPEPGPHDPPGPRYESYDSGPSFGNFGPLPTDDLPTQTQHPYGFNTWGQQSQWTEDTVKADMPWNMNAAPSASGITPGYAKIPLPGSVASPRGTSINIGVESPSSKSRAQSRASNKSPEVLQSPPMSPKSSRTTTKTPKLESERPLSPPMSTKSRATAKSKETEKATAYPPLPESRFGGGTAYENPASPTRSRAARSKAPSISPSDSLSRVGAKTPKKESSNVMRSEVNGAEFSPRSGTRQMPTNGTARGPMSAGGYSHQSRPFSPYRHAPTTEDLLNAAVRGRALVIPEEAEPEKAPSVAPSRLSKAPSAAPSASPSQKSRHSEARSQAKSTAKTPSVAPSQRTTGSRRKEGTATPTPSRIRSPDLEELNQEEARIVERALASATRTPRTSYYSPSAAEADIAQSNFHDMDLCVLLHQLKAPQTHDLVRKVILKAVKQRMKKLRMAYDNESIKQYQKTHHDHDPPILEEQPHTDEPPKWAADLKREILLMQQRIESLGPKIENLRPIQTQPFDEPSKFYDGEEEYTQTPVTQTVNIHTQATGTMAESMYQPGTDIIVDDEEIPEGEFEDEEEDAPTERRFPPAPSGVGGDNTYLLVDGRDDSPGQQFLEEELYKLRQRPSADGAGETTWDVHHSNADDEDYERETVPAIAPTIPETDHGEYEENHPESAAPGASHPEGSSRSVVSQSGQVWSGPEYNDPQQNFPPWQRIHQRLLSWAMIWPLKELDEALNSTTRGHQVNEVAMSIWSTQTYKRYVRSRMTDTPSGVVDRLFVPPNMADAISNAVFNGRHGDACGMLRDLWGPFGLQGMPRLLVVLAKHRNDENHWVVHRFSLPDGSLTTYDSYPERTLPDGRPLGWWFAIRIAWPNAIYPSPDHLMQKMVRLHRPMQLPIDNSVAAGGIWRNILMGSRAERSLDLERLRDLINTEVKNLRQRKQLGKLSINAPRPTWEDMS
ncbi:hypothetical protein VNI00_007419 [Paramarasmius palmivorus]|uniref:Ubiquitin-like protease family profile domain-containing protein n=1 Tax=Paramarasmius palmivorus TaxID=297713 RepID=A0AAW0D2M4_9AGAR